MAGVFSQEDIRLLEKTISIRERILDKLIESGNVANSAKNVEALTGLADSIDRSIFMKAKISIDEANSRTNEETKKVLRDLLLNLHKNNTISATAEDLASREPPKFQSSGMNLKDGELIRKIDKINVDQFLENCKQV